MVRDQPMMRSKKIDNIVIIGPDRNVTVQFEQPRTIVVGSTGKYTTIQHAIDAAQDGDVDRGPAGVYQPVGDVRGVPVELHS